MHANQHRATPACFLGIEGGATTSQALLVDARGEVLAEATGGPANLRLMTDEDLTSTLQPFSAAMPAPSAMAIGLAGLLSPQDRVRVENTALALWPNTPCYVTNDLETAFFAADARPDNRSHKQRAATDRRVLVLSGTGACCYGRTPRDRGLKVGGWGHVLGDLGSAYDIALSALRQCIARFDETGRWPVLGQRILCATQLQSIEDLVHWAHQAQKPELAEVAITVFEQATEGERLARRILLDAAHRLTQQGILCARRLGYRSGDTVEFVLAGGVLMRQSRFARQVGSLIRKEWRGARVRTLNRPSVWGAVVLAEQHFPPALRPQGRKEPPPDSSEALRGREDQRRLYPRAEDLVSSPTEQRNPRSVNLSRMSTRRAIDLFLDEESVVTGAIRLQRSKIEKIIARSAAALGNGGRLFYAGAGTSGRLGVLDASECPPTFRCRPDQVQGVIAGGRTAIWRSVEGAEDDFDAGRRALEQRGVGKADVVVGIAASGRTPFVWGAIHAARNVKAFSVLLCFNPSLRVPKENAPDLVLAPDLGAEALTGSTRLKAGTATKIILNCISTLTMVRLGKVVSNLMVDLDPSNVKLRHRAVRIVDALSGAGPERARVALEKEKWVVSAAIDSLRIGARRGAR